MAKVERLHLILILVLIAAFIWSLINPHDYFTWMLEVAPAIIGFIVLAFTYNRFRFSNMVYVLISLHMIVLMIGGHYTYAQVPFFEWTRQYFGRNIYDRVGHFFQGFVPALIIREMLKRTTALKKGFWLVIVTIGMALAISALYELVEFGVSVGTGAAAEAFLGTQGDVWDTQWDMLVALIGAIVAVGLFSKVHDRSIRQSVVMRTS
ncbi:MAG: DUF2238 domain-containing protein [Candidatus Woesearchaeota archaeon]